MSKKRQVSILLTPKIGVSGHGEAYTSEAQLFYRTYCSGAELLHLPGGRTVHYCPDTGILFGVTGAGKVNAASFYTAVLCDSRFDFTDTVILNVGCGGSATGESIMGDVVLGTDLVDYDMVYETLGTDENGKPVYACYSDSLLDAASHVHLSPNLVNRAYELIKDLPLATTEKTQYMLRHMYAGDYRLRDKPEVLRGTVVTSDTYWKGKAGHARAQFLSALHGCEYPYRICEMEDMACGLVAEQFGLAQRMLDLRVSVNMDLLGEEQSATELWDNTKNYEDRVSEENPETQDLFPVAMNNLFLTGKTIIDAILNKSFFV